MFILLISLKKKTKKSTKLKIKKKFPVFFSNGKKKFNVNAMKETKIAPKMQDKENLFKKLWYSNFLRNNVPKV